ncbi:hypothetical protein HYU95_05750 [Candidatus Daviesbacteria bacterium]|nr:hypothetical protein [Candidatus Daviesbacteria bacterium]
MKQKGLAPILIMILIGVAVSGYLLYTRQAKPTPPPQNPTATQTPQSTSASSLITNASPAPAGTGESANWKTYTDQELIENSGFYLRIPSGWIIKYRKAYKLSQDYYANFRIELDFSPPGWKIPPQSVNWMGWREMDVDVYGAKTNIDQWIADYLPKYKNGLIVSGTKKIGNKTAYLISASPKAEFFDGWIPRYIILGKDYSYELGFNPNGELNSYKIIEENIYPGIYFN